jgi:hypothetical protein
VIAIPATATNSKREVRRSSRDQTAVNIKTPSHRTAGQQKSEPCGTTVSQWSRHRPRRSDQPRVSKYPVLTIGRSGALAAPAGYSPLAASVGYGRSQVKRPCGLGRREEGRNSRLALHEEIESLSHRTAVNRPRLRTEAGRGRLNVDLDASLLGMPTKTRRHAEQSRSGVEASPWRSFPCVATQGQDDYRFQ